MNSSLTTRLSKAVSPFRQMCGNRNLRLLALALLVLETSTPAFGVSLLLFAFARGGAGEVGLVGLVTMVPAAVAAPFASLVADRAPRQHVIALAAFARALLLGLAAAAVVLGLPPAAVYAAAALASVANRVVFPARAALVPSLAASDEQMVAANAVTSTIENIGFVVGPAIAGLAVAAAAPALVFVVAAVATAFAAALAARIRPATEPTTASISRNVRADLVAGFTAIAADRRLRLTISLYTAATVTFGILLVLIVALAVDLLDIGPQGAGALNGSLGAGGIAGGVLALALARRLRPGTDFGVASLAFGAPLALLALWPQPGLAFVLLAIAGAGGVVLDISCYTLVQQASAEDVRARVFGVLEGLAVGAVGLGSALGGLLATTFGVRGALLIAAAVPIAAAAVAFVRSASGSGAVARSGAGVEPT